MKIKTLITLVFINFFWLAVYAQDDAPTLSGSVNISVNKGTMECDFILKNMPHIENTYVIRINSGMNIHYFKDLKHGNLIYYDTDSKDTLSSGESIAYFFPGNKNVGRFLPQELELKYVGMFPIADSARGYSVQDWRGNVAFNGYSVRADGLQSAWYPVLYDMKKQARYENVKYDLNITCSDCSTLFLNGNKPVKGQKARFVSDVPRPLTMYCGRYDVAEINGTAILNPDMDKTQQKSFINTINNYKHYYEENLGIPYKEDITFIQTTPTAAPDHAFLFVSYPVIMNIGIGKYGLNSMFDKKRGDYYKPYLAHELGHYYFGTYLRTNTSFGHVVDEGFAEFLSLKATKNLFVDSIYQKIIKNKLKSLEKFKAKPFSLIKNDDDFNNRNLYVYTYAPVILMAIEKEIGEKSMWLWMKNMLNTKTDFTDYQFFEKTFDASITDKTEAEKIKKKYFIAEDALSNAVATVEGVNGGTNH
ncbi:hypothetical protein [Mucilaginibacter sp.]|uniref:hypothetical protein n=1 Tax=Mucilaginibacter sp. TaxID=1882438 RepID=UPI00284AF1C8|nr:hypothetical protein [Mucilaginibacter sp.]MDR3697947.1 hypothetical protein [Mucilaginibacter sp.]